MPYNRGSQTTFPPGPFPLELQMTHTELFNEIPTSNHTIRRWANQNVAALDAAAEKIATHGANPWVFAADARHFWQFARPAEKAALASLTSAEHTALLGPWEEEDWSYC